MRQNDDLKRADVRDERGVNRRVGRVDDIAPPPHRMGNAVVTLSQQHAPQRFALTVPRSVCGESARCMPHACAPASARCTLDAKPNAMRCVVRRHQFFAAAVDFTRSGGA
ncbi:hypothetical protein MRX96_018341 [Rhipicephalus microplus]